MVRVTQNYWLVGHDYPPAERDINAKTSIKEQKAANKHVKLGTQLEEFVKWRSDRDATLSLPKLIYPAIQVNIRAGHLSSNPASSEKVFFKIPVSLPDNFKLE